MPAHESGPATYITLEACHHSGMTELGDAERTAAAIDRHAAHERKKA
jgi:hypothetical protein